MNRAYIRDNLQKEALEGQQHHLAAGVVSDHGEVLGGCDSVNIFKLHFGNHFQKFARSSSNLNKPKKFYAHSGCLLMETAGC